MHTTTKQRVGCILLSFSLFLLAGCYTEKQIAVTSPESMEALTKHYRLLVDCYVYEELQDKSKLRLIGLRTVAPGVGSSRFPANPNEWIGRRYGSIRVLAPIPKGTEFRVAEHRIVNHPTMGVMHHPTITLVGPLGSTWGPLDGFYLATQLTNRLHFHPQLVAAVP